VFCLFRERRSKNRLKNKGIRALSEIKPGAARAPMFQKHRIQALTLKFIIFTYKSRRSPRARIFNDLKGGMHPLWTSNAQ
jgi:hypothetical protein